MLEHLVCQSNSYLLIFVAHCFLTMHHVSVILRIISALLSLVCLRAWFLSVD